MFIYVYLNYKKNTNIKKYFCVSKGGSVTLWLNKTFCKIFTGNKCFFLIIF